MINKIIIYFLNRKLKYIEYQLLSLEQEIVYGKNDDKSLLEMHDNYRVEHDALVLVIGLYENKN